ncbi:hypothetical protein L2E82_48089 [Cichorium intybus]|uniref:Uncharacterized protein n=1 Tax=Cichorium intybus TaxID=13427 RepID=A0ACB8YYS7_CICIN|nr:hypothetical protein L2E82_48089 [Cichorium intybus]
MASTEAELEQQLKEAGKRLLHPPDSVDELLPVLDQVEKLLSKVDQSPKKSMLDALKPSMRALIQNSLSSHSDVDVKVAVASCISEITRITAPDAPYNDDQMRDVFQLIVSSFEDLADQSSRSYTKRASILETVSKVRSCVIMLDLECDGLIVEMFEHFLRSVRDYHLESMYSSMENIMVLVLEESEEISVEMLKPLLTSVKKDNEGVLPIARKLGEGVLMKSASKLKPYLMPAVISLGDTLDMYTQVVASVCEGTSATIEHNDENASGVQLANESKSAKGSVDETQQADESKLTTASSDHTEQVVKEETCNNEEDATLERSPKSVMSNGVKGDEEASVDQESSKKPQEDKNEQVLDKEDTDESDADVAKSESKAEEQTSKSKGTKSDITVNSGEPSDSSHVEGEKEEAEKQPDVHTSPVKESVNVNPSESEKDETAPESEKAENVSSPSPSQSESLPDESVVKKTLRSKKKQTPQKDENAPETAASPSKTGRAKNKAAAAKIPATVEESEDGGDSDEKPLKKTGKKVDAGNSGAKSSKQPPGKKGKQAGKKVGKKVEQSIKKGEESGEDSDSDAKPLKQSIKKTRVESEKVEEDEGSDSESKPVKVSGKKGGEVKSSLKKKEDGRKRGKNVAEKDQTKSDDEMEESSPKSATKGNLKETPGTSSKRKRNTGKDKVQYDKSLVGKKVKVWWPEDKTYYEGVIESFDSAKKKHKVSYVDGDEEILNLKTQKWEILEEFSARDEEQNSEDQNEEEASPETHKKKKSKTDPTPSASQEKTKDSAKSAKSKGGASKDNKSKENTATKSTSQKTSSKSTEAAAAASKESGKSKEDEETPKSKTVNKSKAKTPTKSNSNGPGKAKSEDVKTPESTKGGSKTGKKRKKRS